MTLNQIQENIYDVIAQNNYIRSDKISDILNTTREVVRKEISMMVLKGIVDGRVNEGYSLNLLESGLVNKLDYLKVADLTMKAIVLNSPSESDLILYKTMLPQNLIVEQTDDQFINLHCEGYTNYKLAYDTQMLTELEFTNNDLYLVIDEKNEVKGYITKEIYASYFIKLLRGVC